MTVAQLLPLLPPGDLWVFGYGSLMWSPGFRYRTKAPGFVFGYHRSLCIYSHRHRGTPERPGLVMGLRRGGSCWGIALRVPAASAPSVLARLWRREMRNRVYQPRLVRVRVGGGREVRAVAFVADPGHPQYARDLNLEQTARLVAQGTGQRGHNLEYLHRTLAHMHAIGVRDPHLERVLTAARAMRRKASSKRVR
jgi:glutathione-specific gamma-glutamylcyclotransferase